MKLPLKVVPIEGDRDFVNVRDAANHRVVEVIRKADGEALVTACNAHDQMVAFLEDIDLIEHPDAGDHNPLCQEGTDNATVLDNIIARARELRAALAAAGVN